MDVRSVGVGTHLALRGGERAGRRWWCGGGNDASMPVYGVVWCEGWEGMGVELSRRVVCGARGHRKGGRAGSLVYPHLPRAGGVARDKWGRGGRWYIALADKCLCVCVFS